LTALTQTQVDKIFQLMADILSKAGPVTLTKADIKGAINDTNTWIDNNSVSYNNALAANVRSALNTSQKSALFNLVSFVRYNG